MRGTSSSIAKPICGRCKSVTAKRDLAPSRWQDQSAAKIVDDIVEHIVGRMSRPRTAGVTRAAIKLGMTHSDAMEPFLKYRAAVADCAVDLLVPKLSRRGAAGAVRAAVQMTFGVVTDAILQDAGPLRVESRQMVSSLGTVMAGFLDLPWQGPSKVSGRNVEVKNGPRKADVSEARSEPGGTDRNPEKPVPAYKERAAAAEPPRSSHRAIRRGDGEAETVRPPVQDLKDFKPPKSQEIDDDHDGPGHGRKRRLRRI